MRARDHLQGGHLRGAPMVVRGRLKPMGWPPANGLGVQSAVPLTPLAVQPRGAEGRASPRLALQRTACEPTQARAGLTSPDVNIRHGSAGGGGGSLVG